MAHVPELLPTSRPVVQGAASRHASQARARRLAQRDVARIDARACLPGGVLASGSRNSTIRLWDSGVCTTILRGHRTPITALAILPGGVLASTGCDGEVMLWW